ncbi:hypothetical protein AJ79_05243 [Helicocarpus griseus UAMH5409]|uniref:Sister chromatid cohesion protein Dcc1 n=1 Tax=Helicocarpus griseus UAMH5409 TaxID=1447875 RepID=A0A2B7XQ44_9EURO|nr:hypothetical protein AJ79_05243 [Helicocarpus griseus UAMH5409]
MTNPTGRALDFTHTSPQRAFKLLELPPELVELISPEEKGDNNKPLTPLYLKSGLPPTASTSTPSTDAFVNLCTPTQTYVLRHVHSSNSIYIIKPSHSSGSTTTSTTTNAITPNENKSTITTISKCNATLELVKLDSTPHSAIPHLQRLLRVYSGTHAEEDGDADLQMGGVVDESPTAKSSGGGSVTRKERTKVMERLFRDVPFSAVECERGWVGVCAFVRLARDADVDVEVGGRKLACWRPSAVAKMHAWKRLLDGAVLQGIQLGKQFLVRDLVRAARGDVDGDRDGDGEAAGFPGELFEAVVRRLVGDPGVVGFGEVYGEMKWASLDKDSVVAWVGEAYLEANAPDPTMAVDRAEFLDSWKDLLPESWRGEATWVTLKACNKLIPCYVAPERDVVHTLNTSYVWDIL